jgi:hypothetical protein
MMRFFDDHGTWADDGLLLGVQVSSPLHLWGFQAMDGAHMNMLRRFCRLHFLSNNDDFHQIKAEATFKSTLKCYNNLKTYICPQIMEWKGQDSGPISITIVTGNIRCTTYFQIFGSNSLQCWKAYKGWPMILQSILLYFSRIFIWSILVEGLWNISPDINKKLTIAA